MSWGCGGLWAGVARNEWCNSVSGRGGGLSPCVPQVSESLDDLLKLLLVVVKRDCTDAVRFNCIAQVDQESLSQPDALCGAKKTC